MRARVPRLRFDPVLEAFEDGPLREFLKAREAIAIRGHFSVRNAVPRLAAVLVVCGPRPRSAGPPRG